MLPSCGDMPEDPRLSASGERGYTLIDLMVAVALFAVLAATTVVTIRAALASVRGDDAMAQVIGTLRHARDVAIAQRRSIEVRFIEPNSIELWRNEIPAGQTQIAGVVLESGAIFERDEALPDTPDGFGGTAAVDFGDVATIQFTADGMLTDAAGIPVNGTVYLVRPSEPSSARAVTVSGGSGRPQGYRWLGSAWEAR